MPYYKATYCAGGGIMQYTLHDKVVKASFLEWFEQQGKKQRLITKITVDFHNGPAAEFVLTSKEPTDGAPELFCASTGGTAAAVQD